MKCSTCLAIREMKIKMVIRFHFILVRMAKVKNTCDSSSWKGCETRGTFYPLLVGVQICIATLEFNMTFSQITQNQSTIRPSYTTLGYIPKKCSNIPQGNLLNYVYSSFICNIQNLETTQMFFNRGVDKENMIHLHNGALHND